MRNIECGEGEIHTDYWLRRNVRFQTAVGLPKSRKNLFQSILFLLGFSGSNSIGRHPKHMQDEMCKLLVSDGCDKVIWFGQLLDMRVIQWEMPFGWDKVVNACAWSLVLLSMSGVLRIKSFIFYYLICQKLFEASTMPKTGENVNCVNKISK